MEANTAQFESVFHTLRRMIAGYLRVREEEVTPDTHIMDDLGADSLALVELGFQIAETFHVPMTDTSGNKLIVRHLAEYVVEHMPTEHH